MSKKNKMLGFRFLRAILLPIFKIWYNPKVIGAYNVPKDGAILIVGNHKHLMDQCMVICATKRPIHYMAKEAYFDKKSVAWFFKMAGCIRVDRFNHDDNAKIEAIEVLNNNEALGLFPEGTRNKTDDLLLPFKFGTVSLSSKTGALIVPFGITGDYKFRSKNLVIRFGEPFQASSDLEKENKKLEKVVADLMNKNNEESK